MRNGEENMNLWPIVGIIIRLAPEDFSDQRIFSNILQKIELKLYFLCKPASSKEYIIWFANYVVVGKVADGLDGVQNQQLSKETKFCMSVPHVIYREVVVVEGGCTKDREACMWFELLIS